MKVSKFDIADYLDSNEMIAEYLNTVLEEGDNSDVITAIGHIAKAIGMTKLQRKLDLVERVYIKLYLMEQSLNLRQL
jgi:probable addiction module antidote protein